MTKGRSSSDGRDATTSAVVERSSAADPEGGINLRVEAQTRRLIDDAAAVFDKNPAEFMIEGAREAAIYVPLDQRRFALDPERYDAFVHALDKPPGPGPKLRALLRRAPAWET
jgi:uncharacterized protein (DUF1778 family)